MTHLTILRILVTGASGQLGSYLLDLLSTGPHLIVPWSGRTTGTHGGLAFQRVDLNDKKGVMAALDDADPNLIFHAAAVSSPEAVHRDPDRGWAVNVEGTRLIANWATRHARRLIFTSTDLVFGGGESWYREDDDAQPILAYGKGKLAAEHLVRAVPGGLVARLALLYGPSRRETAGFFDRAVTALRLGQPREFFIDEFRTPIDYLTVSRILIDLGLSGTTGTIHVGGRERLSRFDLMRRIAIAAGIDPALVRANRRDQIATPEPRPADVSLDTSRLSQLYPDLERPDIETASKRFFA